ncbi:unnamed protein product [Rotaria sp. Silwood2]|nr:unnamed protein product [Rotaria sp. Silwood2]
MLHLLIHLFHRFISANLKLNKKKLGDLYVKDKKSDCWKCFGISARKLDEEKSELFEKFASCKHCYITYSYLSSTRKMNKHIRICSGFNSIQTQFIISAEINSLQSITTSTSSPLISSSSSYSNNKSYTYGPTKSEGVLSCRKVVYKQIKSSAANGREQIKQVLLKAAREKSLALSSNIWSDAYRQQSYLGCTAHWIDDNWTLYSFEIFRIPFNTPNKKAPNVLKVGGTELISYSKKKLSCFQ